MIAQNKVFDLLVIEEASQAFLASIALFSSVAKKVLVIGDHKQLMPIVMNRDEAKDIHIHIDGIIDGLKTFAFNHNPISYRLTRTRRLTAASAALTGLYYEGQLASISDIAENMYAVPKYGDLFHDKGGITKALLPPSRRGFTEKRLMEILCEIAADILSINKKVEVALLSPLIRVESALYEACNQRGVDSSRLTISTIHKIQGLTTDYTILYLPLSNPSFEADDNLFNVATSRAKRGTLIVSYSSIHLLSSASIEFQAFLSKCEDVTEQFNHYL